MVIYGRRLSEVDPAGVGASVEPANGIDTEYSRPLGDSEVGPIPERRRLGPQIRAGRVHLRQLHKGRVGHHTPVGLAVGIVFRAGGALS